MAIAPQSWFIAVQHAFCAGVTLAPRTHVADDTTTNATANVAARSRRVRFVARTMPMVTMFARVVVVVKRSLYCGTFFPRAERERLGLRQPVSVPGPVTAPAESRAACVAR